MEFFSWKESFNTGIEEVDEQHRRFLDCLNECHEQFSGKNNLEVGLGLLLRLRNYAEEHFAYEEEFMLVRGFEGREAQVRQHQFFRDHLEKLTDGVERGDQSSATVLSFMRDWFLKHILEEDRKYVGKLNPQRHLTN